MNDCFHFLLQDLTRSLAEKKPTVVFVLGKTLFCSNCKISFWASCFQFFDATTYEGCFGSLILIYIISYCKLYYWLYYVHFSDSMTSLYCQVAQAAERVPNVQILLNTMVTPILVPVTFCEQKSNLDLKMGMMLVSESVYNRDARLWKP